MTWCGLCGTFRDMDVNDATGTDMREHDSLKDFKLSVREWLQVNGKSIKWLAQNIGKSDGTVKNWLYTSLKITAQNRNSITNIMRRYERGDKSLYVEGESTTCLLGYLNLTGLTKEIPKLELWCAAVEVSSVCYNEINCDEFNSWPKYEENPTHKKLASWATQVIMFEAANTLKKAFEIIRDDSERVAQFMQQDTDGGARLATCYVRELHCLTQEGEFLYIPVNQNMWQERYVELAAAVCKMSTADWVCKTLNDAALTRSISNMEDFFARMTGIAEDSASCITPEEVDDDIPF